MIVARAAAAIFLATTSVAPAQAQRAPAESGSPATRPPLVLQLPPAAVPAAPADDWRLPAGPDRGEIGGCRLAWPCRLQLFGVIERNSGVGLKGTALTW